MEITDGNVIFPKHKSNEREQRNVPEELFWLFQIKVVIFYESLIQYIFLSVQATRSSDFELLNSVNNLFLTGYKSQCRKTHTDKLI